MKNYLIIETQGSHQSSLRGISLAINLADSGAAINLWLIQDAIQLLQLKSLPLLNSCIENSQITVFADVFSIRQRGCNPNNVESLGIKIADIDLMSRQLMEKSSKPIWH